LEGETENSIKETRNQKMAQEERLMIQEVMERGRLLNMPVRIE
jgi:hypothetical protein